MMRTATHLGTGPPLLDCRSVTPARQRRSTRWCAMQLVRLSRVRGSSVAGLNPQKSGGALPSLTELDRIVAHNPVWLIASSGHASIVNSRVLEKVDRQEMETFAPLATEGNGSPTGFLEEHAHACVLQQAQPYGVDDVASAIGRAHRNYVAEGITAVQEAGVGAGLVGYGESGGVRAAYQQAREDGTLTVRTTLMPSFRALHPIEQGAGRGSCNRPRSGRPLRVPGIALLE